MSYEPTVWQAGHQYNILSELNYVTVNQDTGKLVIYELD